MPKQADFDLVAAHKYFSAQCFNQAWDLMDKFERSPEEERLMVSLNQASLYHWSQREDCTDKNFSIGYWQASRIQSILGNAAEALRHAEVCLSYSAALEPFFVAYAHEALARAHYVAGDSAAAAKQLEAANTYCDQVSEKDDRDMLAADLKQLVGVLSAYA